MLTKKTQYALKALGYLASKYNKGPVLISEISNTKKIPIKFLEGILVELKKAEIVDSKKGKGGGYFLPRDPNLTTVAKVIRSLEGPIALLPCVSLNFYRPCADCDQVNCNLNRVLAQARDATLAVLENKTLMNII
jgi:Rrf2 family protein